MWQRWMHGLLTKWFVDTVQLLNVGATLTIYNERRQRVPLSLMKR